ncbi:MAG: luciferase family protein [Chloroflexota bacterium]
MTNWRNLLVEQLETISNVRVGYWKDTDLLCVFHNDKEIAHFQNDIEIDIRLTPKIIKQRGLHPPEGTTSHPNRSKNSRWLVQSFADAEKISEVVVLIRLAVEL